MRKREVRNDPGSTGLLSGDHYRRRALNTGDCRAIFEKDRAGRVAGHSFGLTVTVLRNALSQIERLIVAHEPTILA